MYKYRIVLYWRDEDSVFIAVVPELPGCMAHGDTQEEALRNVGDAIGLWIDTAREFGESVPEPKRTSNSRSHERPYRGEAPSSSHSSEATTVGFPCRC